MLLVCILDVTGGTIDMRGEFLYNSIKYKTQTARFMLSSLRKQGSMNVMNIVDSRFRGNDKLCYIVVIERITISLGSKTVGLSIID